MNRAGFAMRFGTVDARAARVTEEQLLETLAGITPARSSSLGTSLSALRASSPAESTLALVTAPPFPAEVAMISRVGTAFGRTLAVFVYPTSPSSMPAEAAAELEARASSARTSLQRAGWEVFVIPPEGRLADVWRMKRTGKLQALTTFS